MKNLARWTVFTAVTTLTWLGGGFLYIVLSRHYLGLQISTIMLVLIVLMASATALAAIVYAAKLDEEDDPEIAARTDRRGGRARATRPPPQR